LRRSPCCRRRLPAPTTGPRRDNNARPLSGAGVLADDRRFGLYVLLDYRLPWLNLMPYGIYQVYDTGDMAILYGWARWGVAWSAGLNVRINPSVVFKLEYLYVNFTGVVPGSFFADPIHSVTSQLAWAS
jgi:hypothetical protein